MLQVEETWNGGFIAVPCPCFRSVDKREYEEGYENGEEEGIEAGKERMQDIVDNAIRDLTFVHPEWEEAFDALLGDI